MALGEAPRWPIVAGAFLLLAALAALTGQEEPRGPLARPAARAVDAAEGQFGRILSLDLAAAPFPDDSRQGGYAYEGDFFPREGHYDDPSVEVFVPKGFEPRGSVDLVFFFHGWYSSISEAADEFALFRQFSDSGAKALLVLPETARDAPDSFGGKLERGDGFDAMVSELLDALRESGSTPRLEAGRITLAGHSGAYRVISRILDQRGAASKVGEVCLFDALYEDAERFEGWILRSHGRFVSISSQGGEPEAISRELESSLRAKGIEVQAGSDEPESDPEVLGDRVVFLSSPFAHGDIVSRADEFRRVLAAAAAVR